MKSVIFIAAILYLTLTSCKKTDNQPKSKTDYLPINFVRTPTNVIQGQQIISMVNCGFPDHFADIKFLNFEINQSLPRQYEIRAKAFYDNIMYGFSLPVFTTFDTTLTLPTPARGVYILKFYSINNLIQSDTVLVN